MTRAELKRRIDAMPEFTRPVRIEQKRRDGRDRYGTWAAGDFRAISAGHDSSSDALNLHRAYRREFVDASDVHLCCVTLHARAIIRLRFPAPEGGDPR